MLFVLFVQQVQSNNIFYNVAIWITKMDKNIAEVLIALILPSVIGGFTLAYKFLKIYERNKQAEFFREDRELEIAERTLVLREKETMLEIQKLELEIRQLGAKSDNQE